MAEELSYVDEDFDPESPVFRPGHRYDNIVIVDGPSPGHMIAYRFERVDDDNSNTSLKVTAPLFQKHFFNTAEPWNSYWEVSSLHPASGMARRLRYDFQDLWDLDTAEGPTTLRSETIPPSELESVQSVFGFMGQLAPDIMQSLGLEGDFQLSHMQLTRNAKKLREIVGCPNGADEENTTLRELMSISMEPVDTNQELSESGEEEATDDDYVHPESPHLKLLETEYIFAHTGA